MPDALDSKGRYKASPLHWWQFFDRYMKRRWERRHGPCRHLFPTYGDERLHYGLRCGDCFARLTRIETDQEAAQ